MQDIFRALPKVLQQAGDAEMLREPLAFAAWDRVAGESLGRHTAPQKLDDRRLFVSVADEIWRRHLESLSAQMLFRLNNLLGEGFITFIEFQVESKLFEAQRNVIRREKEARENFDREGRDQITPELRDSAESIEDLKLREIFLQAAGNALLRKKHLSL